jgi:5-amino-6-(5-phospho-D-ribitylamino)uracil phosphatase
MTRRTVRQRALYISDLDGTLLSSDGALSDFSRTHLNGLIASGCMFTVASARSVKSMQHILLGLDLKLPIIEFNGACISDFATGAHLHTNAMGWNVADLAIGEAAASGVAPFYSTIADGKDLLFPAVERNAGMEWYRQDRIDHRDPRLQTDPWTNAHRDTHELICLTFIDREARLKQLEGALKANSIIRGSTALSLFENPYDPGWYWLSIHDVRAQKHVAARQVLDLYADGAGELVVFGDNLNDLSMFSAADRCYAVSNAVRVILDSATEVIGSNDDHAVVKLIEKEWGPPHTGAR